jgi:hypothetical protein
MCIAHIVDEKLEICKKRNNCEEGSKGKDGKKMNDTGSMIMVT